MAAAPLPPAPQPPAPPAPKPVAAPIPKIAPEQQVQEDAAAVGMTTTNPNDAQAAPKNAASGGDSGNTQPPG
jgi:hypothetical protein